MADNNALAQELEADRAAIFKVLRDAKVSEHTFAMVAQVTHARISALRAQPAPASGDVGELKPVAWIKPDWDNPKNFDGTSPVTVYPRVGWTPLYTSDMLERLAPVASHETGSDDTQAALPIVSETQQPEDQVERVARALAKADGLDYDEICGVEANPDEGYCDSGTCVAAFYEEHDPDHARGIYIRQARAAIAAMQTTTSAEQD